MVCDCEERERTEYCLNCPLVPKKRAKKFLMSGEMVFTITL